MKRHSLASLLVLTALGSVGCASSPPPDQDVFVAMIMTKDQRASSVPTDSGVLVRSAETAKWHRIGPAIQMISSATADPQDADTIFLACGNGIARMSGHWNSDCHGEKRRKGLD